MHEYGERNDRKKALQTLLDAFQFLGISRSNVAQTAEPFASSDVAE
jgi:hypothetical protein